MQQVAKLIIIDNQNKYLMMYRSAHPRFGDDPDLPGGTIEEGESTLEAMIREVYEEAGVMVDESLVKKLYEGVDYSAHGTHYSLFAAQLPSRPEITMSWEHSTYEWLERDSFRAKAKAGNDTYMHMVFDMLK